MLIWIMTEMYDDGDPGDHAHIHKVTAFRTLEAARAALLAIPGLRPDVDLEDLEADGLTEEDCRKNPELFAWTSASRDEEGFGWDGGSLVEIHGRDLEG